VVVIGSGVAGLMSALELPCSSRVLLLSRDISTPPASRWAQGGLAAAIGPDDSPALHRSDTLAAGAGLCEPMAVDCLVEKAPGCIRNLLSLGLNLDRQGKDLSTTLEAAHSRRRVLHARDQTGLALVELLEHCIENRPNVTWWRGAIALQLLQTSGRCSGVQVLHNGVLGWLSSAAVVLATGGSGHLFANTTNPRGAHGDGIAMAWQAGAILRDMEFVQFHPTALMQPGAPHFLLSEALRGEGARLVQADGQPLFSSGSELLPRDQLSRAMVRVMQQQQAAQLWLDLRPVGEAKLRRQFPTILGRCRELGLDPMQIPLPVAPAAHYWMGGIATDLNAATSLPGLYAVGEVASSGVHGANRLASNSLSECLVMASQLSQLQPEPRGSESAQPSQRSPLEWAPPAALEGPCGEPIAALRQWSWQAAGVERSGHQLQRARQQCLELSKQLELDRVLAPVLQLEPGQCRSLSSRQEQQLGWLWECRQRLQTTALLLEAANFRKESRGGHYRCDAPATLPYWQHHTLQQRDQPIRSSAGPDNR
jgi:L-aspartate oxidase